MKKKGYFRALQAGDIAYIAARLRPADEAEMLATFDEPPAKALARSVLLSSHVWVGVAPDDEPVSIFGVAPLSLLTGLGQPWFVSTDRAQKYPCTLMAEGRRYIAKMRATYPELVNYVDARNTTSVRWLRRMGFTIHAPAPYGVAGLPFHKFEMGGVNV